MDNAIQSAVAVSTVESNVCSRAAEILMVDVVHWPRHSIFVLALRWPTLGKFFETDYVC
jgi:hypothetical protein